MRGQKPQSAQIVKLKNDKMKISNKTIALREKNEPKIKTVQLKCPDDISIEAQKEWRRITKLYKELAEPIVNDLDLNALRVYCESVAIFKKAMEKIRESSEIIKIDDTPKMNPWLRIANDASDKIKKFGELLLLDPVSRARVGLAKTKQEADPNISMFGN